MRVRVSYAVDVTDEYRRAIRRFYGRDGMATRAEVVQWCQRYGDSMNDDLMSMPAANSNPCSSCGMSLSECDDPGRPLSFCCPDCDHSTE